MLNERIEVIKWGAPEANSSLWMSLRVLYVRACDRQRASRHCLSRCEAWLHQRTIWLALRVPAINPQTLVLSRRAHFGPVKDASSLPVQQRNSWSFLNLTKQVPHSPTQRVLQLHWSTAYPGKLDQWETFRVLAECLPSPPAQICFWRA